MYGGDALAHGVRQTRGGPARDAPRGSASVVHSRGAHHMTRGRYRGPVIATLAMGLFVLGTAAACSRGREKGLTLAGSTSVQPFAEKWTDAYRANRPGPPIQVQGGGSTAGVQAALSGAADIGMSSRALTAAEAVRLTAIPVARDGMAVVVHPANPIRALTLADVRSIYAGDRRSWQELGGAAAAITVITREDGSGTRAAFEELVMGGRQIAAHALVQDSSGSVRQMVAADPAAIGYISLGLVDGTVRAITLDGIAASETTIDAGRYPLVRPFLFVVTGAGRGDARAFIDWVTGPEGRELTRREGLLPPRAGS
jgi:phosphate transport system substrate-binding protein